VCVRAEVTHTQVSSFANIISLSGRWSPLEIGGDEAEIINSSPMPGKSILSYSHTWRKLACWFSAKSEGLRHQNLGIKKKKIKDLRGARVHQKPSPAWHSTPFPTAGLSCLLVLTDISYPVSAKASSWYQAETLFLINSFAVPSPEWQQQQKIKIKPSTPWQAVEYSGVSQSGKDGPAPDQAPLNISSDTDTFHFDPMWS
jgi:hypothetical protein